MLVATELVFIFSYIIQNFYFGLRFGVANSFNSHICMYKVTWTCGLDLD